MSTSLNSTQQSKPTLFSRFINPLSTRSNTTQQPMIAVNLIKNLLNFYLENSTVFVNNTGNNNQNKRFYIYYMLFLAKYIDVLDGKSSEFNKTKQSLNRNFGNNPQINILANKITQGTSQIQLPQSSIQQPPSQRMLTGFQPLSTQQGTQSSFRPIQAPPLGPQSPSSSSPILSPVQPGQSLQIRAPPSSPITLPQQFAQMPQPQAPPFTSPQQQPMPQRPALPLTYPPQQQIQQGQPPQYRLPLTFPQQRRQEVL